MLLHEVCLFSAPYRSVMLGCCCLCCEEALCAACWFQGRSSFVTPGNSDDEGYGDVRLIAQARLASARTRYRAQTHTHIPTKRDPRLFMREMLI